MGFPVRHHSGSPDLFRRRLLLRNATLPLHGAVRENGYFAADVRLGTPSSAYTLIVDTGSTMTYVPCASCGVSCGPNHENRAYDPTASATYQAVGCSSDRCQCGVPSCTCENNACAYQRTYAEHSSSSGVLVADVMQLNDGGAGLPVVFGCELKETGEIFKQQADGLLGLGNSPASVINQLVAAGEMADTFSLCYGSVEGSGALLLGAVQLPKSVQSSGIVSTPLVPSAQHPYYYSVKLKGLRVGDDDLNMPATVFDQGYGTVLDSGTTFVYLPTQAYQSFARAVRKAATASNLTMIPGSDPAFRDVCYGNAPKSRAAGSLETVFPTLSLTFGSGQTLTVPPINYLFVHSSTVGGYCLGVFDNGSAGTLLGGLIFRDVLVQYDRVGGAARFASTDCQAISHELRPLCSVVQAGEGVEAARDAMRRGDCRTVGESQRQDVEHVEDGGFKLAPAPGGLPGWNAAVHPDHPAFIGVTIILGLALVGAALALALQPRLRERVLRRLKGKRGSVPGEDIALVSQGRRFEILSA